MNTSTRSSSVSTLAILFWLSGAFHLIGALLDFGFLNGPLAPTAGGLVLPDQTDGLIQAFAAIMNLFVAGGLWGNQAWARGIVIPLAVANLFVALATRIEGGQSWVTVLPTIAVSIASFVIARSRPQD
ncbi:MAG: hypothetical protein AB7V46_21085 [Thermomicrobiales bacterium]